MRILHPLFVHLHIAFLLMAFMAMHAWLIRVLATSVFEDRLYRFTRTITWLGVITIALSMLAGLRDGLLGSIVRFSGPLGGWLLVKAALAALQAPMSNLIPGEREHECEAHDGVHEHHELIRHAERKQIDRQSGDRLEHEQSADTRKEAFLPFAGSGVVG